jgi:hypothetical protein
MNETTNKPQANQRNVLNMNLSFKIDEPTGKYRSFSHATCDIKADKKQVGSIVYSETKCGYVVLLHVKIPTTGNCPFKNIVLAKSFSEGPPSRQINDAKLLVKANWEAIQQRYPIHQND